MSIMLRNINRRIIRASLRAFSSGDAGSGVGRGGGSGGSIREAGGKLGEKEAAVENAYFKKLEREQLEKLRKHHDEEITAHEREIQRHLDSIKGLRERMNNMTKGAKKDD